MSFVFRGSRNDMETGINNFIPERRGMRFHGGGRSLNANPTVLIVTMLLLFMLINSQQMSSNVLLWLGMAMFFMASSLRLYALCQQLQAQAHAAATAATVGSLLGHTELRLRMPPIAFATRGRLHGLRLQLALLDREFDDLDYDALRALDPDNPPGVPSMSEAEINSFPVHKYKSSSHYGMQSKQSNETGDTGLPTSSGPVMKNAVECSNGNNNRDEELTCSVCLEQVLDGELIRSLPCLHQFHPSCIDQWLRQQATCPVCKFRLTSGWNDGSSVASMV